MSKKIYNLPAYINIPLFLYQDARLLRPHLLIAGFIYSLHSSGKSFDAANTYLCTMAKIGKTKFYQVLNDLESFNYIMRTGNTSKSGIHWAFTPHSKITLTDSSCPHCANQTSSHSADTYNNYTK